MSKYGLLSLIIHLDLSQLFTVYISKFPNRVESILLELSTKNDIDGL